MPLSREAAATIDAAIAEAVEDPYHNLPRAVVMVATKDEVLYTGSGGYASLPTYDASNATAALEKSPKVTDESIYCLWSLTKLPCVCAALQLVEQGKLALQDDARQWIEELRHIKVLSGVDANGEPKLESSGSPITIEMLTCHTAGLSYDNDPAFSEYVKNSKLDTNFYGPAFNRAQLGKVPFLHKPGSHWHYGLSNDYLSLVIEAVSGQSLEDYFQEHIFRPLGIQDMTFKHTDAKIDIAFAGQGDGPITFKPGHRFCQEQHWGGAGLSGSPKSYLALIQTLLNDGVSPTTGRRILLRETVDLMFQPHLRTDTQRQDVADKTKHMVDPWSFRKNEAFPDVDWGYGGFLTGRDLPSGRKAGSLCWSGLANLFWIIDRKTGVAFVLGTNILPSRPLQLWPFWEKVEPAIYKGLKL